MNKRGPGSNNMSDGFNNLVSYQSGNVYLNIREGQNDGLVFEVHKHGISASSSISLSKPQLVALLEFLQKRCQ